MIHHGIGVPHEYFNGINAGVISSRLGLDKVTSRELEVDGKERQAYIAALLEHRTVNGIFAAKIQGGQFAQYFKNSEGIGLFPGRSLHLPLSRGPLEPSNLISRFLAYGTLGHR